MFFCIEKDETHEGKNKYYPTLGKGNSSLWGFQATSIEKDVDKQVFFYVVRDWTANSRNYLVTLISEDNS